jgi:hypothetical protein
MQAISNLFGGLVELVLRILWLDNVLLWLLEITGTSKRSLGEGMYRFLNWLGFYEVEHRTALPIFKRGKYIRSLEAAEGDKWHHLWPRLSYEQVGQEYTLRISQFPAEFDNLPTTIGEGRPVPIRMKLTLGYAFEPQNGTVPDAVERMLAMSASERNIKVQSSARPELERVTGTLNPIDVRLRRADADISTRLKDALTPKLQLLGFRLTKVDVEEISLPEQFEAQFVANLELLRQSVRDYSPEELSRMMVAQMGEGLKQGPPTLSDLNLNPLVARGLQSGQPPNVIDMPPDDDGHPPDPKRRRVG